MKLCPESLLSESVKISSLPTIFIQLDEAIEDPECSFIKIAKLIGGDAALSARLLRLANSSFFGFPSQIETIVHATTIIGMAQLSDLILATTVTNMFKGIPQKLIDMKSFWLHSIACGLAARIIATYRNEPNVERFYVMGMFHDLGRLVFYLNLQERMTEIFERAGSSEELMSNIEAESIGFDHAEMAGVMLEKWGLPKRISEVVRHHHFPSKAVHYPIEAAIVHVADIIAHSLDLGASGDPFVPALDTKAWEQLELSPGTLRLVAEQLDHQFSDATQMFLP